MKRYETIFFDLDGTLTDPALGITNSVMVALAQFGIRVDDRRELYRFIGPPLMDSFREFYGFSGEDCRRAVRAYRSHFAEQGIFENEPYPGLFPMLDRLKADGRRLVIATSKPEPFAVRIAEHFGFADRFDHIAGALMDETRTKKHEVIEYALETCGADRGDVLMVGDREHDIRGAKVCGLDAMGVLYGYGSRAELEAAGADYLAETVPEVAALILRDGLFPEKPLDDTSLKR